MHARCTLHYFILKQNDVLGDIDESSSSDGVHNEEAASEVDMARVFKPYT